MKTITQKSVSNMQTNKGQTIKEGQRVIARDPGGRLSPGEYTGYSRITGLHHVSFYNGYTGKFKDLKDITSAN